jgi:hypothetical protein
MLAVSSQTASAKTPVARYMKLPFVIVTKQQFDEGMERVKGRPTIDLGEVKDPRPSQAKQGKPPHPARAYCHLLDPEECLGLLGIECEYGCGWCHY